MFNSREETILLILQTWNVHWGQFFKKSSITILKLLSWWPHTLLFSEMSTETNHHPGKIIISRWNTPLHHKAHFKLTQVHEFIRVLNRTSHHHPQYLSVLLPCTSFYDYNQVGGSLFWHVFCINLFVHWFWGITFQPRRKSKPCP